MNNYNTVLFKDIDNQFYIGKVKDHQIIGFELFDLHMDKLKNNEELKEFITSLNNLTLNQFIIVTMKTQNNNLQITPITIGSLIASDSENEIAPALHKLGVEKLVDIFGKLIPKKYKKPKLKNNKE